MKLIALLVSICGLSQVCYGQAFGFRYGESPKEVLKSVGKSSVISTGPDYIALKTAPQPHALFTEYVVWFSPNGLIKVQADTENFADETSLRATFNKLKNAVESVYGKGKLVDGPIWFTSDLPPLIEGLSKGVLGLESIWMCLSCAEGLLSRQHLDGVVLAAEATKSGQKAFVRIAYEYQGWETYVEGKEKAQEKVF